MLPVTQNALLLIAQQQPAAALYCSKHCPQNVSEKNSTGEKVNLISNRNRNWNWNWNRNLLADQRLEALKILTKAAVFSWRSGRQKIIRRVEH